MDSSTILLIGMGMEVIIFTIFALDKAKGEYDWEIVYPELVSGEVSATPKKAQKMVEEPADSVSLSKKLDEMLSEAKLDVSLMERLRTGIENFGVAVNDINKTTSAAAATQQYGDQLALAANHMESLNALRSEEHTSELQS